MWTSTVTTWPSTPSNVALMTDASTATSRGERAAEPLEQVGGPNRGNLDGQLIQAWGCDAYVPLLDRSLAGFCPSALRSTAGAAAALLEWATRRGYAFLPWGAGTLGA